AIEPVMQAGEPVAPPVTQTIQPVTQAEEPAKQPVTQAVTQAIQPVRQALAPVTQPVTQAFQQSVWQTQALDEQLALWWINFRVLSSAANSERMPTEFSDSPMAGGAHGERQAVSKAKQDKGRTEESPDEVLEPLPDQGRSPLEEEDEEAGDILPLLPGQVRDMLGNFPLGLTALDETTRAAFDEAGRLLDETRDVSIP